MDTTLKTSKLNDISQEVLDNLHTDFFYEAQAILDDTAAYCEFCDVSELRNLTLTPTEAHINPRRRKDFLYLCDFMALSLVRRAEYDVAAIAVYELPEGVEFLWSKNISQGNTSACSDRLDEIHAQQLQELIRETAKLRTPNYEFHQNYFRLMLKNCNSNLNRRWRALNLALFEVGTNNGLSISQEVRKLFKKMKQAAMGTQTIDDQSVIELTARYRALEDRSRKLARMVDHYQSFQDSDVDAAARASMCSWQFGYDSATQELLEHPDVSCAIRKFITVARVFGHYSLGATKLNLKLLTKRRENERYQSVQFRHVESPEPIQRNLHRDWYFVLEVLYYQKYKLPLPILRHEFIERYQSIRNYGQEGATTFVRHAEINLIDYLMSIGRVPTMIGTSQLCCHCCRSWIECVNSEIAQINADPQKYGRPHRRLSQYSGFDISGIDGNPTMWAKDLNSRQISAETSAVETVYNNLMELIHAIKPLPKDSDNKPTTGIPVNQETCALPLRQRRRMN
jgi:hypothetical protein